MPYPFPAIEPKWQKYWDDHATFHARDLPAGPKAYILDMYPYPSGAGLHVGHPEGYTATDILSRFRRMRGFSVLHPMGWDAFGLPAERYAMQTNVHPRITTEQNIATFRRQIRMLGLSYDWSRELDTTDPAYYRWTQWIFLRMYDSWFDPSVRRARPVASLIERFASRGSGGLPGTKKFSAADWSRMTPLERQEILAGFRLAYVAEIPVNWCEGLGTVLANEEVAEWTEKGYTVERRPMRQWMMRITAYADRLLEDAAELDWPSSTLEQQRNWIGRSEGAEIAFPLGPGKGEIRVFTTRPDTLFGATYMVLAPEHPLCPALTTSAQSAAVSAYRDRAKLKSELERGAATEKTGVFTGGFALNPATGKNIPVWVADYVLMGYGTGAIMAVPGHDDRDFEFATRYDLPIVDVVRGEGESEGAFTGDGIAINSSGAGVSLDGLPTAEAKKKIIAWLSGEGIGAAAVQFKLRDWLFSRQRYWGEPIPIVHWDDGLIEPVPESDLPLLLPDLKKFQPTGTTESPLALAGDWVNVVDASTGRRGRRETNTMPQWAGSCWYYLRYLSPKDDAAFCDPALEKKWMPVDLYVGGSEHTVLHLMYARFWHKVLYDLGFLSTKEPFVKLRHQGVILGEDSRKMSKSRGNVVNPDDVVTRYGADSLRLFEMFMGPLEEMKPWSTRGVEGVHRFLNRVWRLYVTEDDRLDPLLSMNPATLELSVAYHHTVKKVGDDIEALRFNTAISQMMIFVNEVMKSESRPRGLLEPFLLLLAPFAPHIAEELWQRLGHGSTLAYEPWPSYDPAMLRSTVVEIVVQVNGRVRSRVEAPVDATEEAVRDLALADPDVRRHIEGKNVVKAIAVKNKIINFVVR
ncbi:MAG TPA: leucine--tRNA ligase [Bacteroidota bacterium]|nr:leucine--tRNA ligase [Bacteroidota bacterium]